MQHVAGISLATYKPVHAYSYYGDINVSVAGSVRPTEPLTEEISNFLASIGADECLWDGSRGVLGRPYVSAGTSSQQTQVTLEGVKTLRSKYIDVKRSLYVEGTRNQLTKEFAAQTKLQIQLDSSVFELGQKIGKVRKKIYLCEVSEGTHSELHQSLSKLLCKLERELGPLERAADAIHRKILQTKVGIAETETGFLRRFALLRSIFGQSPTARGLVDHFYKGEDSLIPAATEADRASSIAWAKVLQAKRFYVDAKNGLSHLYRVENTLKAVLENLQHAMNSQKGSPSYSSSSLPSEVSVNYRLIYIRRLWNAVDPYFKTALPYVRNTSLRHGLSNDFAEENRHGTLTSIFEESGNYGTFSKAFSLLPSFAKVEMSHPLSRTNRIASLHRSAVTAYKFMNEAYDSQEKLMEAARLELHESEKEECCVNDKLIAVWEKLLAIPTENM